MSSRGSPEFSSCGSDYQTEGIHFSFDGQKLQKIHVVVSHDDQAGQSEIVGLARDRIISLLALLQFGRGAPLQLGAVEWQTIEPQAPVRLALGFVKSGTVVVRLIPLPPKDLVTNLDAAAALQLGWYNSGATAVWVIERIRNYFEVLELEEKVTGGAYKPPDEMRWLRNAVSHPHIGDAQIKSYLQSQIGSDHVEPNNERHLRFLESKADSVRAEADTVLSRKLIGWW